MSNQLSTVTPLVVEEAKELASFYAVPQSIINMCFIKFSGVLYPKLPFMLYVAHKKGVQRIEVDKPVLDANKEYFTEARIYPQIDRDVTLAILKLPKGERDVYWNYFSTPVREWGHASVANVRMAPMQQFLPEMAIKRAVVRAVKLFAGVTFTPYEELPEAQLGPDEIETPGIIIKEPGKPAVKQCSCGHDHKVHFQDGSLVVCVECANSNSQGRCSLTVSDLKAK